MSARRWWALGLALMMAVAGCTRTPHTEEAPPPVADEQPGPTTGGQIGGQLNPQVNPPPLVVEVASDLAADGAPAGSLTAAGARARALSLMQSSGRAGLHRLTALRWDEVSATWEAEFATPDGRSVVAPLSHPAPVPTGDPVLDRKQARSWYSVTEAVTLVLDGSTGEVRGWGFRGGSVQPDHPDLEHYRGRIVSGGAETRLALIRPDGTPEGRELTVILPNSLFDGDLAFWHIWYGTGRELEVWGLTGAGSKVVAHRIAMPDPPPENLLTYAVVQGLPVCPECRMESAADRLVRFVTAERTPEDLEAWYRSHLPEYGWEPAGAEGRYASAAGLSWDLEVRAYSGGVAATFTRAD